MSVFLGIDQTGAINHKGLPRPLPACILEGRYFEFGSLKSFSQKEVEGATGRVDTVAIIDCVLGLPSGLHLNWREAIQLLNPEGSYGRYEAEKYFLKIGSGKIWHRKVEKLAGANSLFRSKPYQRNIQTGTYRFWLDMARDPHWFRIPWLLGEGLTGIRVYEGYPSFLWRFFFPTLSRQPSRLKMWTENEFDLQWTPEKSDLIIRDPNFADALILAIAGQKLLKKSHSIQPNPEGWILGVAPKQNY